MEVLPALNLDMREQLSSDDGVYKFFHPMNYQSVEGLNMIFHSLTFARSRLKC